MQFFRLPIERLDTHLPLCGERLFGEQLGIEQDIGNGRLGLVGNIGDEGFDLGFLFGQALHGCLILGEILFPMGFQRG